MVRGAFPLRTALCAVTASVAIVTLTTGQASAWTSASGSAASAHSAPARCQASELRISVPAAISGDPAEGMGKHAWNVVFRNIAGTTCSLRGWPRVMVQTTTGKAVPASIGDVRFSNLAVVPASPVVLRPGQSAVVTAMSPTASRECVTSWMLKLTLPGTDHPVTVRQPAGFFAACVGGRLQLSPFYPMQTLTGQIKKLSMSAAPPPFPATTAPEPPVCMAAALRAGVFSTVSEPGGSIIELRLGNGGSTCVLPGSWPSVGVQTSGASQVAKLLPDTAALQAEKALLVTYQHGTAQKTALTLRRGGSVSIALLAPKTGTRACSRADVGNGLSIRGCLRRGPYGQDRRAGEPVRVSADPLLSSEPSQQGLFKVGVTVSDRVAGSFWGIGAA